MDGKDRYELYLQSAHWSAFKKLKAQTTVKRCAACSCREVHLHHMLYRDPLELAQLDDTCWLCRSCHETFHHNAGMKLLGVPYASLMAETVRTILGGTCLSVAAPQRSNKLTPDERHQRKMRRKAEKRESIAAAIQKARQDREYARVFRVGVPADPSYYLGQKVSYADQAKWKSKKGGFTRKQLSAWGVTWPPLKGWSRKLHQGMNPNI